ncbi:MAG: family 4 glycosyl hydrolase [Saccharofermentanales bacterium]
MIVIVFIGASFNWVPTLMNDLLSVFPEQLDIRFVDIDSSASEKCRLWGEAANRVYGRSDLYSGTTERRKALVGANAVIITLSTGGFDAMEKDLTIPEKYGIFATVGDTCGPSGWARGIRNIPVFREFATDFEEIAPKALIVNYSNPMAILTSVLQQCCSNPVIGLCHSYFEIKDIIQHIFGLPDWSKIELQIAGVNHFTWVTDFKIDKNPGYPLLQKLIGERSLADVLPEVTADELGFISGHKLCAELYDNYGYLPYPADRHTCEFTSFAVCGNPKISLSTIQHRVFQTIDPYGIKRTSIPQRVDYRDRSIALFDSIFTLEKQEKIKRSRETGSDMIRAYLYNSEITDAVNMINSGQIAELPIGACVETLGTVDGHGVHPIPVRGLPPAIAELIRPTAVSQLWLVEGMLRKDSKQVFAALINEAQCRGLSPSVVNKLGHELVDAMSQYPDLSFLQKNNLETKYEQS